MNHSSSVLILMSTYNGEKFLAAQINSLLAQTFSNWTLIIRDDGSTDNTVSIIQKYCASHPNIIHLEDSLGNLKVPKSFSQLLQQALTRAEDFIFFCDQDDIWLPHKLATQVALLHELQETHGTDCPLLVHSDLRVVDQDLKEIHPSYLNFEKLTRNSKAPLHTLLINNFVTGCTVGMNRSLLRLAYPIPDTAFMHDWWCALCAATSGKIGFTAEGTMLYRQHSHNSVGSKGFYGKITELFYFKTSLAKRRKNFTTCFEQAKNLLARIQSDHQHYPLIRGFTSLTENKNLVSRYFSATNLKLKPAGKIRAILFWVMLGFY